MSEPEFLTATRSAYDAVAEEYAEAVGDAVWDDPFARAMLRAFAETVRRDGPRPVADVGCGPGRLTGRLHGPGPDAFGADPPPENPAIPPREQPDPRLD